jgi:hypothetical protein
VNRPIKIQLKLKSNSPTALPLCERGTAAPNSGTAAPAGEISSQFKNYPMKFQSVKFLGFLQGSRSQIEVKSGRNKHIQVDRPQTLEITTTTSEATQAQVTQGFIPWFSMPLRLA